MIEAAVALLIALVAGAIGFGVMQERVSNVQKLSDERHKALLKEIDYLKKENEVLNQINVSIAEMRKDIHYIREKVMAKK